MISRYISFKISSTNEKVMFKIKVNKNAYMHYMHNILSFHIHQIRLTRKDNAYFVKQIHGP